jgi:hypothetical protein
MAMSSYQANFIQNITPEWAAGGINHEMPKMYSESDEEMVILKVRANGYGRLFLVDDQDNILVSWNPDSHESNHALGRYVAAFFDSTSS